jgi:hypothetical protein
MFEGDYSLTTKLQSVVLSNRKCMPRKSEAAMKVAAALLAVVVAFTACSRPTPRQAVDEIPPGMPVVELSPIDLGQEVPAATDQRSPSLLGRSIPLVRFAVRFEAHRPIGATRLPYFGTFLLYYRGKGGTLLTSSNCHVKLTGDEQGTRGIYQGVCNAPSRKGEAIVELQFGGKCYLVRSAQVR